MLALSLSAEALDTLTQAATALDSFAELIDADDRKHGWFPTLNRDDPATQLLADIYDETQAFRGDPRRAWRGTHPDLAVPLVIQRAQRRGLFLD